MDLVFGILFLAVGVVLLFSAFSVKNFKFSIGKELRYLSERNQGIGIMHGMVRRSDGKGVVADRKFCAPSHIEK